MEGLVLLGLLGAGYLARDTSDTQDLVVEPIVPTNDSSSSGTTVYNVQNFEDSKKQEMDMLQQSFVDSKQKGSNVIDSANPQQSDFYQTPDIINSMGGVPLTKEDFLMNDQGIKVEPFFSGSGPRNINFEENLGLLNHQGGVGAFKPPKKEFGQFFELEQSYGNVYGNQFEGARSEKDRYISGDMKTNELPFQQEKTPPIDSKNQVNMDIGAIHAERNSTDNLRSLNNPKLSFGGVILGGEGISKRTEEGEVFKNSPDQDYLNTADKWLVTTCGTDGPMLRPEQVLPDTNRTHLNESKMGSVAPNAHASTQKRPQFKKSTNQQFAPDTMRNASLEGLAKDDSHNVGGYFVYPNERETTGDNYFVVNTTPVHEASTTRLQDIVKPTIKETTNYSYTGDGGSNVPAQVSSDQFMRADVNINKELIAEGRSPTPESVKLANGMDNVNIEIDKIESDYFTHYISGSDRIYQEIPTDNVCEYTQDKDTLDNVKLSDRLDPTNLDPFRNNPYTQSLSSFY